MGNPVAYTRTHKYNNDDERGERKENLENRFVIFFFSSTCSLSFLFLFFGKPKNQNDLLFAQILWSPNCVRIAKQTHNIFWCRNNQRWHFGIFSLFHSLFLFSNVMRPANRHDAHTQVSFARISSCFSSLQLRHNYYDVISSSLFIQRRCFFQWWNQTKRKTYLFFISAAALQYNVQIVIKIFSSLSFCFCVRFFFVLFSDYAFVKVSHRSPTINRRAYLLGDEHREEKWTITENVENTNKRKRKKGSEKKNGVNPADKSRMK